MRDFIKVITIVLIIFLGYQFYKQYENVSYFDQNKDEIMSDAYRIKYGLPLIDLTSVEDFPSHSFAYNTQNEIDVYILFEKERNRETNRYFISDSLELTIDFNYHEKTFSRIRAIKKNKNTSKEEKKISFEDFFNIIKKKGFIFSNNTLFYNNEISLSDTK